MILRGLLLSINSSKWARCRGCRPHQAKTLKHAVPIVIERRNLGLATAFDVSRPHMLHHILILMPIIRMCALFLPVVDMPQALL
jgi:hypothetical protein